jgi:hypothetical protein
MNELRTDFERAEYLVNLLISASTGGERDERGFKALRGHFLTHTALQARVPDWLRTCRSLERFWAFIKRKFDHYSERREFIWAEFGPLLALLEKGEAPAVAAINAELLDFSEGGAHDLWRRALERMTSDPEGAITPAKSLLESVLKHILDERKLAYSEKADLPELYRLVAKELNLAPDQHTEENFKRILGGITSVVNQLSSLRNRLRDAHGRGKGGVRPAPRHAELAVNLAGSIALFLVETATK